MIQKCNALIEPFENFWRLNPALLYGLSMLLGISLYLAKAPILILALILIFFAKKRAIAAFLIVIASYFYISINSPSLIEIGKRGVEQFSISSVSLKSSHFGKQWIYKGIIKNIPVSISVHFKHNSTRPPADRAYFLEGSFKEVRPRHYVYVLEKNTPWKEIPNTFSFAEWRYYLKYKAQKIIHNKIKNEESALFLSGIATGEFDDRMMSFHFSRFGLQHIMSISGFHFAILSAILHAILQCILSRKNASLAMILFLTGYFIFLGFAPSILRAYVMIMIVFIGSFLNKGTRAMNSLGVALMAVLLIDPLLIDHIGFQFSFVVTLSILFFYSEINYFLQNLTTQRFLSDIAEMHSLAQHGFIIFTSLRQALSLTVAVNLAAFPLMLFHFEQFPYLSILYNLFFPFMVSFSMLLLILSLAFPFVPFIDSLNSYFTKFLLDFAYNLPQTIDYKFHYKSLSFEFMVLYFTFLFFVGVVLTFRKEKAAEIRRDFAYL